MPEETPAVAPIGALLSAADVLLDVDAGSREALLERAAAHLAARSACSRQGIFEALLAREKLGSTALGHGVALPHARMATLMRAFAVFVRTEQPISFDAPDRRPVAAFLVLLIPKDSEHHLTLMTCAARQLADRDFRHEIRTSMNPDAIAALFRTVPKDSPSQ